MKNKHIYTLNLQWLGEKGLSTIKNDRKYLVEIAGKPSFIGSADKVFHGDPQYYNPEDLLLASLSACHMMSYFYVCRKAGIEILSYNDHPEGALVLDSSGSGRFTQVILKPIIAIANVQQIDLAIFLHKEAGKLCFIANSVNFEIVYNPIVRG